MPDTSRTLAALLTLFADNTSGDIGAQDARDALVSFLAPCGPEIAVTGATAATIGQVHACADAGSPADYTLTLPAASGNAGRVVGVRVSPAMTKFVTVDGNASETIDGATTRLMWAGESALLLCDGSNWFKLGGRSRPMFAEIRRTTSQAIGTSSVTLIQCATVQSDPTGAMADATNYRVNVKRPGFYAVSGAVCYTAIAATSNAQCRLHQNGTLFRGNSVSATGGAYPSIPVCCDIELAAADYVDLRTFHAAGSNYNVGVDDVTGISVCETPSW